MDRMAGALHALGVRKGDRVGVFAHNGLDYLLALFGAWRLGAIAALVNVKFADELAVLLGRPHAQGRDLHARHAWPPCAAPKPPCRSRRAPRLHGRPAGGGALAARASRGRPAAAARPLGRGRGRPSLLHLGHDRPAQGRLPRPRADGARLPLHRRAAPDRAARRVVRADGAVELLPARRQPPAAAVRAAPRSTSWAAGRRATGWDALDAAGATMLVGNPTLLEEVLAESRARGRAPGRLRFALTGGGPLPPTLKAAWRDELGLPIVESYGQSELGGFVALGFPELVPRQARTWCASARRCPTRRCGSSGRTTGRCRRARSARSCCAAASWRGYWGKPEKTAEATRGGWLRTGDLGVLDEDGFITLRSRRAELVTVAGVALVSARRRGGAVPPRRRPPGGPDRAARPRASGRGRPPSSRSTRGGLDAPSLKAAIAAGAGLRPRGAGHSHRAEPADDADGQDLQGRAPGRRRRRGRRGVTETGDEAEVALVVGPTRPASSPPSTWSGSWRSCPSGRSSSTARTCRCGSTRRSTPGSWPARSS